MLMFKEEWQFIPLFVVFNWDLEEMYANKIHSNRTTNGYLKDIWCIIFQRIQWYYSLAWLQREGCNQMEMIKVLYVKSIVNIKAKVPLSMNG